MTKIGTIETSVASDYVKTWIGNATGAEYGFFRAVAEALVSFNDGDNNKLAKMLTITHGKTCKRIKRKEPARLVYATHLKRILDQSLEGVEYKFNKDSDFGVIFDRGDNGGVSVERIKALKMLGSKSIRDKAYKEAFPVESKAKDFDPKAWAERAVKAHPKQLEAMIAALQSQRG